MNELPIYGTGERAWLVGRYGAGKAVVLADSAKRVSESLNKTFSEYGRMRMTALDQAIAHCYLREVSQYQTRFVPYTIICELQTKP